MDFSTVGTASSKKAGPSRNRKSNIWEVSEGITKQGRFEITVSMYLSMRPHSVLHEKCRRLKAHHRIFLRNKSHPVVEDGQLGEGTDHLPSAGGKKAADHRPPWSCS